jgi:hypothetical protein
MKDVTALVLFCCTKNLIDYSIGSFRKFYPNIKLIIIDNSGKEGPECLMCTDALKEYCKTDKRAELVIMPENLGHGLGMHYGLQQIRTQYTYVFESDVTMEHAGLIEAMLELMTSKIYSVGPIMIVCYDDGKETSKNDRKRTIRRLWPYASLLSTKTYFEYPGWNSHDGINAAPLLSAMRAIADSDREDELMIEFDVDKYVHHRYGGTRTVIGIPKLRNHRKWTSHYLKSI